jgi:cellobiose-specific phosphotransferase system component IIA
MNNFEGALQVISQITQPTPEDLLMRVRFLYGLKRYADAQSILAEAERTAGTAYRDEIALLKAAFLSDQKDWRGTIALLSSVLVPQFDTLNNRMVVNYLTQPPTPGTRKLSEEGFFRACSLLALAYARNGDPTSANALLAEMQMQSAMSGNVTVASICTDTTNQLAAIGTVIPGRGGGLLGNRNEQQWSPSTGQGSGSRTPQTPLAQGTDLEKFRRAEQLYRSRNYEGVSQQLEQMLSGFYNQISMPPVYIIHYNIDGAAGKMNAQTFAKACSLLALAKAQLGDFEQANAVLTTFSSRIRMTDPVQENLLRET